MDDGIDIRRKKALFRAQRRGFRELDLLFGVFAEAHLASLDETQLSRFEALLSVSDWQVYGWIVGHEKVPEAHDNDVFALLRAYRPQIGS